MLYRNFCKRPTMCFMMPDTPWYLNENTLLPHQTNMEQIVINGIENSLLIMSCMIFYTVATNSNPCFIIRTLNKVSQKFMKANIFYVQSAVSTTKISMMLSINNALGCSNTKKNK